MTEYSGEITNYRLFLKDPTIPSSYKRVIYINGSFGGANLYFIPERGELKPNRKRPGMDFFDIYYFNRSWAPMVDLLRNEKPCYFYFIEPQNWATIKSALEEVGEEET